MERKGKDILKAKTGHLNPFKMLGSARRGHLNALKMCEEEKKGHLKSKDATPKRT